MYMHRTHERNKKRLRAKRVGQALIAFITFLPLFSRLTNPFVQFSIVRDPFVVITDENDQFSIAKNVSLTVYNNPLYKGVGYLKAGWHIAATSFSGRRVLEARTTNDVIEQTHDLRFDTNLPYLISGDHFSVLYPRSLGIFYHTLLDPRTARGSSDWQKRQIIYLKTIAYALETFANTQNLATTIVPVGASTVTTINIFSLPSDTLYSLLYGLTRLQTSDDLFSVYPFTSVSTPVLQTQKAADTLLMMYAPTLQKHLGQYLANVEDIQTGLVKNTVILSGTKDSVKRTSAFYDNVILWKTHTLAQKLGLEHENPEALTKLKTTILATFWDEHSGYFKEDLTQTEEQNYSSDWLIAIMTGFLDLANPKEMEYAKRSVSYIQAHALDQPFGLKYQPANQKDTLHLWVKVFAPSYATTAIWSHWGMEYSKLLARLYQETCDSAYLKTAKQQVAAYETNIQHYGGFPELYNAQGKIYTLPFYKSVHATGWIVNFEQTRAMVEWTAQNNNTCIAR